MSSRCSRLSSPARTSRRARSATNARSRSVLAQIFVFEQLIKHSFSTTQVGLRRENSRNNPPSDNRLWKPDNVPGYAEAWEIIPTAVKASGQPLPAVVRAAKFGSQQRPAGLFRLGESCREPFMGRSRKSQNRLGITSESDERAPTARCRGRPKDPVDLAKRADCFHVAPVYPMRETICRAKDSHQPFPALRDSNGKRNASASSLRQDTYKLDKIGACRPSSKRIVQLQPDQITAVAVVRAAPPFHASPEENDQGHAAHCCSIEVAS